MRPNYSDDDNVRVVVTAVTSSSVQLQWGQLPDLPQDITDVGLQLHYGYRLIYRSNYTGTFTEYGYYGHNVQASYQSAVVEGLQYNHPYIFKVEPYRQWQGMKDYGWPYPWVTATTLCVGKFSVVSSWCYHMHPCEKKASYYISWIFQIF